MGIARNPRTLCRSIHRNGTSVGISEGFINGPMHKRPRRGAGFGRLCEEFDKPVRRAFCNQERNGKYICLMRFFRIAAGLFLKNPARKSPWNFITEMGAISRSSPMALRSLGILCAPPCVFSGDLGMRRLPGFNSAGKRRLAMLYMIGYLISMLRIIRAEFNETEDGEW